VIFLFLCKSAIHIDRSIQELHETGGEHTCDKRSPKSTLEKEYPTLDFPNGFVEDDPLWDPNVRETPEQQDVRSKRALSLLVIDDVRCK
jgi:hypothetical protein